MLGTLVCFALAGCISRPIRQNRAEIVPSALPIPPTATPILPLSQTPPTATSLPAPTLLPSMTPSLVLPSPLPTIPQNTFVAFGSLPDGFSLTIFAEIFRPVSLAGGDHGEVYVGAVSGEIYQLWDADEDGIADAQYQFATGYTNPLGLLWYQSALYVSYKSHVAVLKDEDGDHQAEISNILIADLPGEGLHQNDSLALGRDGYLYLGMGSDCDACPQTDARSASILRFLPDGSGLEVFAQGLRNPFGVAFNAAGDLFATENGRDDLGQFAPAEELNHIRQGLHYGWQACWQGGSEPGSEELCAQRESAIHLFTARSSADGLVFYPKELQSPHAFPAEYQDNALVAIFGSYVYTDIPTGIQRLQLQRDSQGNYTVSYSDWFLRLRGHADGEKSGRPLGLWVAPDGTLFVSDYEQGAVYAIIYGARP
ncbi:MAG TPA: PQQ-dependent sugar dehydrogenase [Anaerolineales bacterium]|nr:PQQ-dependent sugar dehydrogenase [Anaerolineales bacterium]